MRKRVDKIRHDRSLSSANTETQRASRVATQGKPSQPRQLLGAEPGCLVRAMEVAREQVREECGLLADPTDPGYLKLYNAEVRRRADNMMANRVQRADTHDN